MESSDVKRLKDLEADAARKRIAGSKRGIAAAHRADLAMDNQILKELFVKKGWALPPKGN